VGNSAGNATGGGIGRALGILTKLGSKHEYSVGKTKNCFLEESQIGKSP